MICSEAHAKIGYLLFSQDFLHSLFMTAPPPISPCYHHFDHHPVSLPCRSIMICSMLQMKKCKLTVGLKFDLVSHKIAMLMDKDAWMEVMVRSDIRFGKLWTYSWIMSEINCSTY